jgi:Tol biopolymer transport system component
MKRVMLPAMWLAVGCGLILAAERPPQVVFSSNRSGHWRIWMMNPDGSKMRQLTKGAADRHDVDPVLRPDGKAILFTSTRGDTTGAWIIALDTPKLTRICDGDQAEWSPDGKQIVFRRRGGLVTRDLESGTERIITPADWTRCSGPAWSPDGASIAFASRRDAGNALFIVPAKGGRPKKVYDEKGACEPHWSPDGKRLVYETETHICTINPDGTGNRPVTWYGGLQRYGRFSPDGKSIIFCQGASPKGPWELYVVPTGGGTPRKLTDGGSDMYPHWR